MKEVKELAKQYMDEMMDGSVSLTTIKDEPITIEVRFYGLSPYAQIERWMPDTNDECWIVSIWRSKGEFIKKRDFKNHPPLSRVIQLLAIEEFSPKVASDDRFMEVSYELR